MISSEHLTFCTACRKILPTMHGKWIIKDKVKVNKRWVTLVQKKKVISLFPHALFEDPACLETLSREVCKGGASLGMRESPESEPRRLCPAYILGFYFVKTYLFIWKAGLQQREGETEFFDLLIYSPNGHYGQSWVGSNPRSPRASSGIPMWVQSPKDLGHPLLIS